MAARRGELDQYQVIFESPPISGKWLRIAGVDGFLRVKHYGCMSTLDDIKKAVEKLSSQQKQELIQFLGALLRAESSGRAIRSPSTCRTRSGSKHWAASHERGPALPDSAIGRDAIYD